MRNVSGFQGCSQKQLPCGRAAGTAGCHFCHPALVPDAAACTQSRPHPYICELILPACREKAIFGPAKQTSSDEVFAAIKRTFQALDDEIIKEATSCDIADCQFGGSTAVIACALAM